MIKLGIICHYLQRVFQVVAWLLTLAIVVLSLGPPSTLPVTRAGHNLEHLLIFVATSAAFGLGYPRRFLFLPVALLTFTAAIEVAQMLVPGRHARERLSDRRSGLLCRNWTFVCLGKINGRYEQRLSVRYGRC